MKEYMYIRFEDELYPQKLKEKDRMPGGLYIKGRFPDPDKYSIAIVGARNCSAYGKKIAYNLAAELAAAGVQIISGLALGIDSYAHQGAIDAGGKTFAVLGCGIDSCYPVSNTRLYRNILEKEGGVISEFPPGAQAMPYHFPIRNRIISGLSDAVVIVEAKRKSGSLITANYAIEQGVQVYAVPGRVTDALSAGTNDLIDQGAQPLFSSKRILEDLGIIEPEVIKYKKKHNDKSLSENEEKIRSVLSTDPETMETLCMKTGLDLVAVSEGLLLLEIKGYAEQFTPGNYICR